ncbi:MAG: hypothetical protein QGI83_20735, partial [Candidatus Latescibacteria bacterium]|nr:hypothetical protein [Candidatus Latescibacterota bacterium]
MGNLRIALATVALAVGVGASCCLAQDAPVSVDADGTPGMERSDSAAAQISDTVRVTILHSNDV